MTPATQLASRYVSTSPSERDLLLALASKVRRIERALSGNYSTPAAKADARRLLVQARKDAADLWRALK